MGCLQGGAARRQANVTLAALLGRFDFQFVQPFDFLETYIHAEMRQKRKQQTPLHKISMVVIVRDLNVSPL